MKIAYVKRTRCNSGGTERVVFNKSNYLIDNGYDVTLITSEFRDKQDFFPFSARLKRVDLDINYSELKAKPLWQRFVLYWIKSYRYRRRLTEVLLREKFDVVVSMFGSEISWINSIGDGSRKINEVHFSRNFRELFAEGQRGWPQRLLCRVRDRRDHRAIRKFDLFVVLSLEDLPEWGALPNIRTIYNSVALSPKCAELTRRRAIAVGRISYQKGFDMLVAAWALIHRSNPEWVLDIYGGGCATELQSQIDELGLGDVVRIKAPTAMIYDEILDSSIYLMTSRYEGLPMVLLEANSCGVPAVAFGCKCGPRDIIEDGVSGYIVPQNNIECFAQRTCELIESYELRQSMGARARKIVREKFSEEVVMAEWENVFNELINR